MDSTLPFFWRQPTAWEMHSSTRRIERPRLIAPRSESSRGAPSQFFQPNSKCAALRPNDAVLEHAILCDLRLTQVAVPRRVSKRAPAAHTIDQQLVSVFSPTARCFREVFFHGVASGDQALRPSGPIDCDVAEIVFEVRSWVVGAGDAALRIHNTSTLGNVPKIAAVTHRRGARGGRGRGGRGRGGRVHHAQHPARG